MFDKQLKKKIQSFLEVSNGISSKELKSIVKELDSQPNDLTQIEIKSFNKAMKKIIKKDTKKKNKIYS
jgi:hypothetical protein